MVHRMMHGVVHAMVLTVMQMVVQTVDCADCSAECGVWCRLWCRVGYIMPCSVHHGARHGASTWSICNLSGTHLAVFLLTNEKRKSECDGPL
jgi:hypothetical protein